MMKTNFFKRTLTFNLIVFMLAFIVSSCNMSKSNSENEAKWVGTWATAPQLVEPHNIPPAPGLTNNTLRQIVRVSIGGETIRLKFSNEFSNSDVTMKSVQIALSAGGHQIDAASNVELKFDGKPEVTMNAGAAVLSDPVKFKLLPRTDVAITIYYGETSETITGHPGSRTTSYIIEGNNPSITNFDNAVPTDHWYNINNIDVLAPQNAASVAILGNSITDGRGSVTNQQNRWPDILSERLVQNEATKHVGVLNMGIGGNAILAGGLGPTGLSRYERDILNQSGVQWAIIFHGVNDIGGVRNAEAAENITNRLISAYQQMITLAHERNIKIYGATIMPFNGNGYHNEFSEQCRNSVNDWIRNSGSYDAVIDFDKAMQSPDDSTRLPSSYQNDGLHPDAMGYQTMGQYVDLDLFVASEL